MREEARSTANLCAESDTRFWSASPHPCWMNNSHESVKSFAMNPNRSAQLGIPILSHDIQTGFIIAG